VQQERHISKLREQFIAVLGHDLRNPLQAVVGGLASISRTKLEDKAVQLVPMIQASVGRMSKLIDDVLDFARGRLGDGLILTRTRCDLVPVLSHVVAELRISHPGRLLQTSFAFHDPIDCDPARLSQVLSNLLANAITYGAPDKPIAVRGLVNLGVFELSVSNEGEPIPHQIIEHLFEPFERGTVKPSQQGLGLGLYIASQITMAHGATLSATSTPQETRFTFRMPIDTK
jgi:sigma-B regulation protein RsbU (phosphoserine phosphatase)